MIERHSAIKALGVAALMCLVMAGCTNALVAPSAHPTGALAPSASPSASAPASLPVPTPMATSDGWPERPEGATESASLGRVVDGDTIRAVVGGVEQRIRYIGMDTPESMAPGTPVEPYSLEATAENRRLLLGGELILERDVSEVDGFGRLLRYIWIRHPSGDYTFVNLELVLRGYAQVSTYPPDVRYVDVYLAAQREARESGRGLWAP